MFAERLSYVALVTLMVAIGCAKNPPQPPAPEIADVRIDPQLPPPPGVLPPMVVESGMPVAPMPRPKVPAVVRWVPGTKEEQAAFIAHIPEPIRKLYGSDFQCFTDLEGKAFAWEYAGGPVRLWLEFEEKGQSTVPRRYPEREDWVIKGDTGRVIFWVRRGVSDKINSVLKRAGKPEGDTSAVGLGVTITSPAGGQNNSVGYKNPLWYGWDGYSFASERPVEELRLPPDEPAAILVLDATETKADGKGPRRAKLVLKMQRIKPE